MEIKEGYLYHISNDFFKLVNDPNLPINHSGIHSRPSYFLVKEKDLLWFIPLSSKVSKYQKWVDNQMQKYGRCDTILITKIANRNSAVLIQNAFPTLPKYLSHPHTIGGKVYKVPISIQKEIKKKFRTLKSLKEKGLYSFYPNTDKIELLMYQELKKDKCKLERDEER